MKLLEKNILGTNWTHGEHSEDMLLLGQEASEFMVEGLEDEINEEKESTHLTTIKIDGAPSVICATNFKGKCFVAKKGLFNKEPQYATTPEECDMHWGEKSPDLAYKMKVLLKWLPLIKIPDNEMWQGDFLFTKEDLKEEIIDGEKCITFHPNTILYAIPLSDPKSTKILRAEAGVCWHTRYVLDSSGERQRTFRVNVNDLQSVPAMFMIDATIPDFSGKLGLDPDKMVEAEVHLNEIKRLLPQLLNDPNYPSLVEEKMRVFLNKFKNSQIKEGKDQYLYEKDFEGLIDQENEEYSKKSYKRETKRIEAEQAHEARLNALNTYKPLILLLWTIQNHIIDIKEIFLNKLNKLNPWKAYLMYTDGSLRPTNGEGFVVSDIDGNAQKWVSRLEFSKANFSPDVIKGWDNPNGGKKVRESKLKEDMMDEIQNELDPIFNIADVENKKKVEPIGGERNPKGARYVLMPSDGEDRERKAQKVLDQIEQKPEIFDEPSFYKGGSGFRTPIINTSIETSEGKNADIILNFKPKSGKERSDSRSTKADEIYWAQCMSWYNYNNFENFPNDDTDFDEVDLSPYGLSDVHPKTSNKIGYIDGSKILLNNKKYFDNEPYYFSREEFTFDNGSPVNIPLHSLIIETAKKVMRGFNQKDDWNPSDVYACKKSYYPKFIQEWEKIEKESTGNFLNTQDGSMGFAKINKYLNEQLLNKNLIGISLKDTNFPKIEEQNINDFDEKSNKGPNFEHCTLTEIRCPALMLKSEALRIFPTVKDGSRLVNGMIMGLGIYAYDQETNTPLNIYYRSFGDNNLYIDAGKDGQSARLGKMPKFIFNNLLIDATNNKEIKLPGEKSKRDVIENILRDDTDLIEKIKIIEKGPIPITYPENTKENNISVINWSLFKKKYLMNKDLVKNFDLPARQMDPNIDPILPGDILALYIWPKLIDFIYMLEVNADNMEYILKTLLQGSAKTYHGCAPFIKLY